MISKNPLKNILLSAFLLHLLHTNILSGKNGEIGSGWNLYPPYMRFLRRLPKKLSRIFFYRAVTGKKIVALTFDDGPARRTPEIIKLLKQNGTPATFFLLASRVDKYNARFYDDPLFSVGIHGWKHPRYDHSSRDYIAKELGRAVKCFHTHRLPVLWFRPPYGLIVPALPDMSNATLKCTTDDA